MRDLLCLGLRTPRGLSLRQRPSDASRSCRIDGRKGESHTASGLAHHREHGAALILLVTLNSNLGSRNPTS